MAATGTITVELVFGLPGEQELSALTIDSTVTVGEAIRISGIADKFPQQHIDSCTVGIWGRVVTINQSLQQGDRIEIYRPLQIDPRDARRQLAEHGGFMGSHDGDKKEAS